MTENTMRTLALAAVVLSTGCIRDSRPLTWSSDRSVDVAVIPGCPVKGDGTLSRCLRERAVWGAMLWEDGVAHSFIVSGNAVHNRYIEAEALATALVALGVPSEVVHTETQALHSDENAAYSFQLAQDLGKRTIGVASHTGHANLMKLLLRSWGADAVALELDFVSVAIRLDRAELDDLVLTPVSADEWLPLDDRETVLAHRRSLDRTRARSHWVYPAALLRAFVGSPPQPQPPVPEPTRFGSRHRVDTAAW